MTTKQIEKAIAATKTTKTTKGKRAPCRYRATALQAERICGSLTTKGNLARRTFRRQQEELQERKHRWHNYAKALATISGTPYEEVVLTRDVEAIAAMADALCAVEEMRFPVRQICARWWDE